jgi:hypothetical protein
MQKNVKYNKNTMLSTDEVLVRQGKDRACNESRGQTSFTHACADSIGLDSIG